MVFSTLASAQPTSRPVAVKVTGPVWLDTDSAEKEIPAIVVLAGNDSNTAEGTVNVPAEVGAWQVKSPTTKSVMLPMFDHTNGDAIWSCAVKAPTSGPPLPLSKLKVPPEAGMNDVSACGVL